MLPILRTRTLSSADPVDWVDREFGRLMRQFWSDGNGEMSTGTVAYPVEMWEDDDHVYVDAELPGFSKDNVDITIEQGILHISAERTIEPREHATERVNERRYTKYYRCFTLPTTVDDNKVSARLDNGVLHVTLPKTPEVKPRRVQIN